MNELNEVKEELDELIGDEEKEANNNIKELLKEINSAVDQTELKGLLIDLIDKIEEKKVILPAEFDVLVKNKIKLADEVEIKDLKKSLNEAIAKIPKSPDKIKIGEMNKPKWYTTPFTKIAGLLSKLPEQIASKKLKVKLEDVNSKNPVAVRLSDGKKYYNAILEVFAGKSGSVPFKDSTGNYQEVLIDSDRYLQDEGIRYSVNHMDDFTTANVTYIGKEDKTDNWVIMKMDESGNFPVFTYATITNNPSLTDYAMAWAVRATTATYSTYGAAF